MNYDVLNISMWSRSVDSGICIYLFSNKLRKIYVYDNVYYTYTSLDISNNY